MKYLSFGIRTLRDFKLDLLIVLFYSIILTVYSVNWNVINPFEFLLYTRYFILPGFIIWCIFSSRYHHKMFGSLPLYWLKINNIANKPEKIIYKIVSLPLLIVFLFFSVNGILISSIITVVFSSNFSLFLYLLKHYMVYYCLTFMLAWILGIYIADLIKNSGIGKQIIYATTTITLLLLVIYIDYKNVYNMFINWKDQYIHPILNFGKLTNSFLLKAILIVAFTILFILYRKLKNNIAIITSFVFIIIVLMLIPVLDKNELEFSFKSNDSMLQKK